MSLPLRELEAAACLRTAVLLALDDARIARQEPALLQNGAQIRLERDQRFGDSMAQRTRLSRQTAAGDLADDVVLTVARGGDKRLAKDHAQHGTREVDGLFLAVDVDATGARLDPDARDRVLALARGIGAAVPVELRAALLRCRLRLFGLLRLDQRRFQI